MIEDYVAHQDFTIDTYNRDELGKAFAAAGVVRAGLVDGVVPQEEEPLRKWLAARLRTSGLTPWRDSVPGGTRRDVVGGFSASVLARVWDYAVIGSKGARLACEVEPGIPQHSILPRLLSLAGQMRGRALDRDAELPPSTGVASVVIPRVLFTPSLAGRPDVEARYPDWNWPLQIGIMPGGDAVEVAARLRQSNMVKRNLATVSVLRADMRACNLLIATDPLPALAAQLRAMQLETRVGAVIKLTAQQGPLFQMPHVVDVLRQVLGVGAFASSAVPTGLEATMVDMLVRTLSHNLPFDVAVWHANAIVQERLGEAAFEGLAPTIIVDRAFLDQASVAESTRTLMRRLDALREDSTIAVSRDMAYMLKLEEGERQPSEVAAELRLAADGYRYDREADEASYVAELGQSVEAEEAGSRPPDSLYADLTFYREGDGRRVDDGREPLVVGRPYTLEVALREVRTGISYRGEPPDAVVLPDVDAEMHILVVLSAHDEDFDIPEPVQSITMQLGGRARLVGDRDGLLARFRVTPIRRTRDEDELAEIEVRLYYEFNLLEHVVLRTEVLQRGVDSRYSTLGIDPPIFIEQQTINRSYLDLTADVEPRGMGIDVRRVGEQYRFAFTIRRTTGRGYGVKEIVLHGRSDISAQDLTRELNRIRRAWTEIAMDKYAKRLDGPDTLFRECMRTLARAGRDLWSLLFRREQGSAMWEIGKWLEKNPLVTGSVVEVAQLPGAKDFVFPWSLLYEGRVPRDSEKTPAVERIWGLKYNIMQNLVGSQSPMDRPVDLSNRGAKLAFMLYDYMPNAAEQSDLLSNLDAKGGGNLAVTLPPVKDPKVFHELVRRCDADLLYFYTHGYTRPPDADRSYSEIEQIRKLYKTFPRESAEENEIYRIIHSPDFEADESWIALTSGRLFLRDLMAEEVQLTERPVVILNMCLSARVLPAVSESFVSLFLGRRARSVIGTECPMTTTFAHPFSRELLLAILQGESVGEALRKARCYFIEKKNPLGLAYTLFGSGLVRYEPEILALSAENAESL